MIVNKTGGFIYAFLDKYDNIFYIGKTFGNDFTFLKRRLSNHNNLNKESYLRMDKIKYKYYDVSEKTLEEIESYTINHFSLNMRQRLFNINVGSFSNELYLKYDMCHWEDDFDELNIGSLCCMDGNKDYSDVFAQTEFFNRLPIVFKKELEIVLFGEVMKRFNHTYSYCNEVKLSLIDLRNILNINTRKKFDEFINGDYKNLFVSNGNNLFDMNIFEDNLIISVNKRYFNHILYKDNLLNRFKEKHNKNKQKEITIIRNDIVKNISGKYNKLLYKQLSPFKNKFFIRMNDFRDCLNIPNTYKMGNIQKGILSPCIKELLKNGIEINEIRKIKTGRSISNIEIYFKKINE